MNPDMSNYARASSTPADRRIKSELQRKFVKQFWLFMAAVIGLLMIVNLTRRLITALSKPTQKSNSSTSQEKGALEAAVPGRTGKVSVRRLPAAIASLFRVVAFRTTVPIGSGSVTSITELAFIMIYTAAMLIWLFVDTRNLDEVFYQDRAAHLASCQLPLILALAGKNNIISFMTGVGHEKLNVLHRAGARACFLLLLIHGITRYATGLSERSDLSHGWMRWGVVSLVAMVLVAILSVRPIRNRFFEFFLISHIILIAIFLVGGYLHAADPGFGDYIWPAFLVWGLDRFLRFGRLFWNNRIWKGVSGNHHSSASVELLTKDTIRLTLRRKMSWLPGQHAYVVLPSVSSLPTEAHPFTMASIPKALDGTEGPEEKEIVFIIRGRNGFTRRLREHASQNGAGTVPAYVDGPYGTPPNLKVFSTCILISGGAGVSYTLPLLLDLVHHARKGSSSCRRVVFVWAVREPEHMAWISKLLTSAVISAPSTLAIEPRIYVTGARSQAPELRELEYDNGSETSAPSSDENKKQQPLDLNVFKLKKGRPDVHRLIKDAVATSVGAVSVDVAGPSSMASAVRKALSSEITSPAAVLKGSPSVTLHTETFGMVKG